MKKRTDETYTVEGNPLERLFSSLEISEADLAFMSGTRSATNVEYALAESLVLKFLIREARKRHFAIEKLESELVGLKALFASIERFRS